jgi:hypothetical protein
MTLHRPIAQEAQPKLASRRLVPRPVRRASQNMNLTTFSARTTEPRGIAVMLVLEAFKTPKAHMVAIEGYGISLSHSAIF